MQNVDCIELEQFLRDYPGMAIRPSSNTGLRLKGAFAFSAEHIVHGHVVDSFELQIDIPSTFPRELPQVTEIDGRIPRQGDFHVNGDGSLCLGSHLRLLLKLNEAPTLPGFASRCIVPYLFAISLKLKQGGSLVFGELPHYGTGMFDDYMELFSLPTKKKTLCTLKLLGMKKRIANKRQCPCGCMHRLGRCKFNRRLLQFRKLASRGWFKRQLLLGGA
jgi:hypothetical protein